MFYVTPEFGVCVLMHVKKWNIKHFRGQKACLENVKSEKMSAFKCWEYIASLMQLL